MLACLAIDHLQRTAKGGAVAYIYCDYKRQQEQTVENLAASLVKQYVQQSSEIPKAVRDLYKNHNNAGTRPSVKEMFELLQVMNASFPRVFIIVDALDELPRDGQIRPQFLKFLHTLQTSHPCNLMVTSRDIPHILQEVRHSLSLEVRAKDEDIRMYIAGHDFPKFVTRDVELHSSILNSIIKAADGMYVS